MKENYIPHQNLEDPSNIIANSKSSAGAIFNNNNFEEIKQQIQNQNDYINDLKNELEFEDDVKNNLNNIGIYNTENIKLTIHQQLAIASSRLLKANERIKFLTQENNSLKKIIENKDKIISDFEKLSLQFKSKFEKLEQINRNLKNQLQSENIEGYNRMVDINENIYDLKPDFYYQKYNANNQRIIEDINNNKEKFNSKKKIKIKNNELLSSLINIKKDLESIEIDYNIKLKEKDCYIEQINCELIHIYQEYVKLSDILEELNYLVKNSDYNELKTEFNCLLREKEILLKEKEKNHIEIISLREKFARNTYDCKSSDVTWNKELINIFSEKEKNYINEINDLKDNLVKKIKEIEELKNNQESIIREYEMKIEMLLKKQQ